MKKLIFLFFMLLSSISWSQESLNNDMKEYLSNNGTLGYYAQVVDRMFDFLKNEYQGQQVPEELWEELSEVKPEALNDITQSIIQSYKAHFSDDELVDMLTFYNSEVGKKANSGLQLSEDEMKIKNEFSESIVAKKISKSSESLNGVLKSITQDWSTQLFADVQAKLNAKGFTKQ